MHTSTVSVSIHKRLFFLQAGNVYQKTTAQKTTEQNRTTLNITATHSDRCRNGLQNTSLKCRSLSAILSGCKLVVLALAGRYLWAKSLKNKKLSLCLNLPTDRGLWRPPTELGTELWSQLKTLLYGTKWKRGRGESYKKQRNIEHCCYFFLLWFTAVCCV